MTPTRPILRWLGGKWRLAPWIIEHFPPHRIYVEPFGGAASVLLRKERAARSHHNAPRTEVLWVNPECAGRIRQPDLLKECP